MRILVDNIQNVENGVNMRYVEISADSSESANLPTAGIVDGSLALFSDTGAVKVFNEADVRREGGRTGVRIFRHHLATSLLANDTEAPVISSILGHRDPNSLNPYLDADIEHLRECALSIEQYPVAEEAFML